MHSAARLAVAAPVIETERLRLRGHRLDDFDASFAMWADPVVTRHIGGRPFTREEVWARLLRYAGHWALLGFGYWALEEKTSGEFIGELGFADMKREIDPPLGDAPELGWALATRAHGKGYATEAVRAVVAWGDQHFGPVRTVCIVHPANLASIGVAGKCGYHELQRANYKEHETIIFARDPVVGP
jgi:RimJ/RimL family protein N-acetyltransferase